MFETNQTRRRDRVDWYPWMVRYEAGESQKQLAAEAGCSRATIARAWTWFSALPGEARMALRRRAFRRVTARIESDVLRGLVDGAGRQARGLDAVRRLFDAMEDEMTTHSDQPGAAGGQHDEIDPATARAELLARLARHAERRTTKAMAGSALGCGTGRDRAGLGPLGSRRPADPPEG